MRVYCPATPALLHELARSGLPAPLEAFAVTAALRAELPEDDEEELEYTAFEAAAAAGLSLLGGSPDERARRVVVAADVPDADVRVRTGAGPAAVLVTTAVRSTQVASVHVDEAGAEDDVRAATGGSADALAHLEQHDLLWYAAQEVQGLLTELDAPAAGSGDRATMKASPPMSRSER